MMTLFKKAALATALLASSASVFAGNAFTIDTAGDTSIVLPMADSTYTATALSGPYQESVVVNPDFSFSVNIFLELTSLINGSEALGPLDTGLGINYGLYSIISLTGNVLSNTLGTPGGSLQLGNFAGSFDVFWDLDNDTGGDIVTAGPLGSQTASVALTGNSDDINLASTSDINGGGATAGLTNGGFSVFADNFTLSSDADTGIAGVSGESFFVAPRPFYLELVSTGNLGDFASTIDFTAAQFGNVQEFNRQADVAFIPEPSSIALLGLGLIGAGFASRRKNK